MGRGGLVRVLARWTAGTVTTTALLPLRRGLLPSVDKVLHFLVERLGTAREPEVQGATGPSGFAYLTK